MIRNTIRVPINHRTHLHIAMIFRRGKLLASATNSIGSRSRGCGYSGATIHAERAVIKKLGDEKMLNGSYMVVVRLMKNGPYLGNSEPCEACKKHLRKCIEHHGLLRIYYS